MAAAPAAAAAAAAVAAGDALAAAGPGLSCLGGTFVCCTDAGHRVHGRDAQLQGLQLSCSCAAAARLGPAKLLKLPPTRPAQVVVVDDGLATGVTAAIACRCARASPARRHALALAWRLAKPPGWPCACGPSCHRLAPRPPLPDRPAQSQPSRHPPPPPPLTCAQGYQGAGRRAHLHRCARRLALHRARPRGARGRRAVPAAAPGLQRCRPVVGCRPWLAPPASARALPARARALP